jgi:RimJ/RimL family protein N-acetyltransferase
MIKAHFHTPSWQPEANMMVADMVSMGCFGRYGGFDKFSTMAVTVDERLVGGTVFHNWSEDAGVMELSSFSSNSRWLTRHVINCMMYFPFNIMQCQCVVMRVSEHNHRMKRIAERFGFSGTYIPRLRGRNEGEFIYTLTDDTWTQHPLRDKDFSANIPV